MVCDKLSKRRWVRDISGALTMQALCDYIRVWELVDGIILQPLVPDHFIWRWSPNGVYMASSTYRVFFNKSTFLEGASELWKAAAPPKVKLFF